MKQCPICSREVISKRKDAVFCQNAACRKKAHQARLRQPAPAPSPAPTDKATGELTFPDGRRWRVELSPLAVIPPENRSRTDPRQPGEDPVSESPTSAPSTSPAGSLDQIPKTLPESAAAAIVSELPTVTTASTSPAAVDTAGAVQHAAPPAVVEAAGTPLPSTSEPATSPKARAPAASPIHTVELWFSDLHGARVRFSDAVRRRWSGYIVRSFATPRLGMRLRDGYGLGGSPGQFRTHYPDCSPADLGFDDDIAVLYADETTDEALAPAPELLQAALGSDWRLTVREYVIDHKRASRYL